MANQMYKLTQISKQSPLFGEKDQTKISTVVTSCADDTTKSTDLTEEHTGDTQVRSKDKPLEDTRENRRPQLE